VLSTTLRNYGKQKTINYHNSYLKYTFHLAPALISNIFSYLWNTAVVFVEFPRGITPYDMAEWR